MSDSIYDIQTSPGVIREVLNVITIGVYFDRIPVTFDAMRDYLTTNAEQAPDLHMELHATKGEYDLNDSAFWHALLEQIAVLSEGESQHYWERCSDGTYRPYSLHRGDEVHPRRPWLVPGARFCERIGEWTTTLDKS